MFLILTTISLVQPNTVVIFCNSCLEYKWVSGFLGRVKLYKGSPTTISNTKNNYHKILHITTYPINLGLLELTESLKNLKYDIIGCSEVRRLNIKIEEQEFLYYIGKTPWLYGEGSNIRNIKRNT